MLLVVVLKFLCKQYPVSHSPECFSWVLSDNTVPVVRKPMSPVHSFPFSLLNPLAGDFVPRREKANDILATFELP